MTEILDIKPPSYLHNFASVQVWHQDVPETLQDAALIS
jgi:hypothetical protein